jgi:1-acyl-sn-glycerol-3-phosphate acyltransferase
MSQSALPYPLPPAAQLETLTRVNVQDLLVSFGLENVSRGRAALEVLARLPARRFARQMVAFDQRVASVATVQGFTRKLEAHGQELLPAVGPLLVFANHPGMTDTLALFASLPRPDLRIIAAERPFLRALQHVSRHLIYVTEEANQRMAVVRAAANHLRQGGAVLTFPAGEIEPDPACMPGARRSLDNWSESMALFARLAPETNIVTAIVSGVLWPTALYHPLTRLRRQPNDRERLGATLQLLAQTALPFYRPVDIRVAYSPPRRAAELANPRDAAAFMAAVRTQARHLLEAVPQAPGRVPQRFAHELNPA